MDKIKGICRAAGFLLLILAAALLYACIAELPGLRSAEDYEDKGIYTFEPHQVLPHQVKNNSSGRDQRMNPTKTVYMVYYREVNGAGYRWSQQTGSKDSGLQVIEQGRRIQRRVLSIPEAGTYITVDPQLTAQAYADGQRSKIMTALTAAGGYLVFYPLAWGLLWLAKKRKEERRRDWEN